MTKSEIITHDNMTTILGWLEKVIGWKWEVEFEDWAERQFYDRTIERWCRDNDSLPEKIRKALAVDKIVDIPDRNWRELWLEYFGGKRGKNATHVLTVEWDVDNDPTKKLALITATLEYLKGRE